VIYNGGFYDAAGISIDRNTAPEIISGMYLSLNTYASLYMDDFDYYVDGQHWFKVIITAINYDLDFAPQKEIILADYRFNSLQGYKFDEWQYIDLTWIGEADSLYFEFQSSDIGDWGINTPTYFCLDEINSNVPNEIPIFETEISESIEIAYGETADLLAIAKGGVQPYSYYWDNESTLDDSYLQNPIASPENTTLYSVTVSDAIGNNEVLTVEVIVNPTGSQEYNRNITTVFNDLYGNVNVECSETMSEIQIYDINGRLVKKVKPNNTRFGFNTTDLSNAMYFLRIQHSAGVELQKFIVNNQ
jgi:hypothetical protein